jgi:hypothetical protein
MKYSKPEVKLLGLAISTVHGESKEAVIPLDNMLVQTTSAYQSDE